MLRRILRLLALAAIAVVALIAIGLLVLHTNPVQARILDWSIRELEQRFDLDLTASDLRYNLAARRVTMTDVRLAAVGHSDNPFFTSDAVTVQLPWAAYRGRLRFDNVSIDAGRVTIVRDAQGRSNLPPGRGRRDPNAPPRHIDIRGLDIGNLDFVYRDVRRDVEIRVPGIRTDLSWNGDGAAGPIAFTGDTLVRVRDRRVTIDSLAGRMVFDGSNLTLENVDLDTTDGSFVLNGEIVRALDRPTLDLTFEGNTPLAQSSRWANPPITIGGEANIKARMTGAPSRFELDAVVSAPGATVGNARGVAIDAEARLTPDRLVVSQSTIRPATGGEVHATVDLPFDDDARWWVKASYEGIDAATAFRLSEVEPLPFGASLSGTALIEREPGEPFRLDIQNTSARRNFPGTAPLDGT
ncbi:MAG: hypothetical protein ACRELX_18050, partial [Longimicrobiales bacterium]